MIITTIRIRNTGHRCRLIKDQIPTTPMLMTRLVLVPQAHPSLVGEAHCHTAIYRPQDTIRTPMAAVQAWTPEALHHRHFHKHKHHS